MPRFQWPGFDTSQKLSREDAVELASRVAELTKAGLPLAPGLRALAAELSGRRLRRVLRQMADRLDAGMDLAAAIDSQGNRLPAFLRGLVLAGVHSGRLAETLEEYVELERSQLELGRRVWLALAYPLFLLAFMSLLAADYARPRVWAQFATIYADFGAEVPTTTWLMMKVAGPVAILFFLVFALLAAVPLMLRMGSRTRLVWPLLRRIPLLGPLLRWSHLAQFSRLMCLLLEQQVPLPDALRLTATGLRDASLARGCVRAADEVQNGGSLGESLAARRQFPASLIPLVQWGERGHALADAFRAAAEMFEGRCRSQSTLLQALLLPIMLLAIFTAAGLFIGATMLPLISLIQRLSGGG
jgi:type II secretory pathway component PulF